MPVKYVDPGDTFANTSQSSGNTAQIQARNALTPEAISSSASTELNNNTNAYLASVGVTPQEMQQLRTTYTPQAEQEYNQLVQGSQTYGQQALNATVYAPGAMEKIMGDIALAECVATAALAGGAIAGVMLGSGAGAGAAGVALSGTAGAAQGAAAGAAAGLAGSALTGQNVVKGTLLGAVGGGIGSAVAPLATDLSDLTGLNSQLATGIVKGAVGAGTNALGASLNGGNVGNAALTGGLSAGVGSLASSGLQDAGLGGAASNVIGNNLGKIVGGMASANPSVPASSGNSNMMANTGNTPSYQNYATGANTLGNFANLAGAGLGFASASTIGGLQQNAYTTAANAGNTMPWNVNGTGGLGATFTNGQANLNAGGLSGAQSGFGQFANSQAGMANMYGSGQLPAGVTQAGNTYMGNLANATGYAGMGQMSGLGMMGMGTNTMNNSNANYNSAYQNALTAGQGVLNPQIQQQSNALLNSEFERGQAGTSGGALQTQALQNSFNTAELQNQAQAVGQANSIYGLTNQVGLGQYNAGASTLNNFNNASANYGNQGLNAQMGLGTYSPQLASMYNSNASNASTAFGNINNIAMQNAQFGLNAGTNQGNQLNAASRNETNAANTYNGGALGAGSSLANAFGSALGGSGSSLGAGANSLLQMLGIGGSGTINSGPNAGWNVNLTNQTIGMNQNATSGMDMNTGVDTNYQVPQWSPDNSVLYQNYGGG